MKKSDVASTNSISSTVPASPGVTSNTVTSPLSMLEPKAPLGDFVVSRTAEKKQAIVKPVLTHVIGEFVIQESSEPFPVSSHLNNMFCLFVFKH